MLNRSFVLLALIAWTAQAAKFLPFVHKPLTGIPQKVASKQLENVAKSIKEEVKTIEKKPKESSTSTAARELQIGQVNNEEFKDYFYPTSQYNSFLGLDDISLFSSDISVTKDFVVVGQNGYSK